MKSLTFIPEMVRAIRQGRKTQTCRIWKGAPPFKRGDVVVVRESAWMFCTRKFDGETEKGNPKFRYVAFGEPGTVQYISDCPTKPSKIPISIPWPGEFLWRYKPARFVPGWACRTHLEVVSCEPERLHEITEDGAKAEGATFGIYGDDEDGPYLRSADCDRDEKRASHGQGFRFLWDSINAKRGHGWETNPLVSVTKFKVVSK